VALSLAYCCPSCGQAVEGTLEPTTAAMTCASCGHATPLPEAAALATSLDAARCPVCGSHDLYAQRDFNRVLGLCLVALGVLTGPFTKWISTVVFIGLDAFLYLFVPPVAICYACEAQQRGFAKAKGPKAFDIAIHDAYRFGKRFPPRRDAATAGPYVRRRMTDGKIATS
jgi:DNA-directed RNA polymerase subunit RPC12/RpoP